MCNFIIQILSLFLMTVYVYSIPLSHEFRIDDMIFIWDPYTRIAYKYALRWDEGYKNNNYYYRLEHILTKFFSI